MSHTQRKALHLAGVYVNNFTNHLVNLAQDYLEEHAIDPSLTHALVQETMLKVLDIGPKQAQTGPAIRGDAKTIAAHLAELPKTKNSLRFTSNSVKVFEITINKS